MPIPPDDPEFVSREIERLKKEGKTEKEIFGWLTDHHYDSPEAMEEWLRKFDESPEGKRAKELAEETNKAGIVLDWSQLDEDF